MPAPTKEENQSRAQLVRVFEASCHVDYPTPEELNFRIAVAKQIGLAFALKEVRKVEIAGPATPATTPQRPTGAKKP